ncbi:hypothetical protein I6N95_02745 [Vagococcus sp. BWB3-3]|uniref:Phosphate acetyl/butaryl transferase domain-containing protein n=1 Tax=Vagococcus allomyrinae TaxID=2794353 RepID=A0A940P1U5_9ENTE|nr:phosphate acyltransferase [Vagococcus allomyrinae]MBP1039922.1 hypothetical protein [Vagococcus allomyrinae]
MLRDFSALKTKSGVPLKQVGVINPTDSASLLGIFDRRLTKQVVPVLIGDQFLIEAQMNKLELPLDSVQIVNTTPEEAPIRGVRLVREGAVDVLMKGHIQTSDFLRPIVAKETGIVADQLLTHVALNQVEAYPKLLLTTDGGMVSEPNYDEKIIIIQHGLEVLKQLGYQSPKVAVLAAAETVNKKVKSSVEAKQLKAYFETHASIPCDIDGPISFDLAVSPEIAKLKHYESPVAGQADMLVGPDMTAMNLVGKSMMVFGKGKMAGIVCGAKVPIVMTSRGSNSEEKYLSILLATLVTP